MNWLHKSTAQDLQNRKRTSEFRYYAEEKHYYIKWHYNFYI